ncbi:putative zinc-binding metallopeptidase [Tamlana sp. s12]|uniref:zinc-binding metallopeptidase family protein n=1 Tax=Tamlana sp. s12 TaxID=1630406 RepID=UPI0007FF8619|nr:putative zinc-binding metallopeptidase [Tamlana sp. s12]OBQ54717.1 hypothetical protein VQ01_11260 [Tamlana sp. s12]QQY82213.1 putative zinc-binding metallopeptidase [Tamlana sp. s12]
MKVFQCSSCDFPVFFENTSCENCNAVLGYLDAENEIFAKQAENVSWEIKGESYKYCENHELEVCNWLVATEGDSTFCNSCHLNRTIPDLSVPEYSSRFKNMEVAKHRLVYALERLGLPVVSQFTSPDTGLFFDFLPNNTYVNGDKVMTGHTNGVVTILLAEADAVSREKMRVSLNEKYRTLIGHFRHEVGHYYWDLIFKNNEDFTVDFRKLFGDERVDYGQALSNHYQNGASKNWKSNFISEYASSHPWEDWAETWSHYLHIMDTMETAFYFGLEADPNFRNASHMKLSVVNPYEGNLAFKTILAKTTPLFYAVNSINRSMGIKDVYPFVISDKVKEKLEFIHNILQRFKSQNKMLV